MMSTGTTQLGLLQEKRSQKGDAPHSALQYLFQEVSKLASPNHSSFLETDCMWSDVKEAVSSCHCPSVHESVSHKPLTPVQKMQSPLKVLSLINLQCEKLLHQSEDDDDEPPHATLFFSDVDHSKPDSAPSLCCEGHSVRKTDCQLKGCSSKVLVSGKCSMHFPHKATRNTSDAPRIPEFQLNVLDLSSDWTKECLSTQHTFYDFLPEAPPAKALSSDEQPPFITHKDDAPETSLPLDHNANICLNPDDLKASSDFTVPQFPSQPFSSLEQQPPNIQVNTASKSEDSSGENPAVNLVECSDKASEPTSEDPQCAEQRSLWRSKRRKQARPIRSASLEDPDFQGVTFQMDTELDDTKEQCRLLITSKYSSDLPVKRTRLRTRMSQRFLKTSSDEDSDSATSEVKDKACASCSTKKTPMWRDAEDGTPLCNACGIRYKKYRVRCTHCWNIPKKDGNSCCSKCGHFVRLTSAQRKPTV